MALDYENYGIFLIMGNAGFKSSTLSLQTQLRSLKLGGVLHERTRGVDASSFDNNLDDGLRV